MMLMPLSAIHFNDTKSSKAYVRLDSALEMYRIAIGAHSNQSQFQPT
jgi:hypothetical protein